MSSHITVTSDIPEVLNPVDVKINFYQRLQNILFGKNNNSLSKETMSSRGSSEDSQNNVITAESTITWKDNLIDISPTKPIHVTEKIDDTNDLLTGAEFDSFCDVTMQEMDYLVKCGGESNNNRNLIDWGKESLFVKFDPLYAKKVNDTISATCSESVDSNEVDIGYETSSATSAYTDNCTVSPNHSISSGSIQISSIREKPMQVVPPVVNCDQAKTSLSQARTTPALVRSVSAILTPSHVATDRLISISGSTPPTAAPRSHKFHDYTIHKMDQLQSMRGILQKQDQEVLLLRQANRELRLALQDMEHKHKHSIEEYEFKIKKLTEEKDKLHEGEHKLKEKEDKLLQKVNEKSINIKQMSIVMEEYEKTISFLISEQQSDKLQHQESINKLVSERDQTLKHLSSMESSFNDLLSKYEKCKNIILEAKEKEKVFDQTISDYEVGLKKYEEVYHKLKQVTSEQLSKANETLDNIKKTHSVEVAKLNATIKKHDVTIASLEESLAQKTRNIEELTRICDQLISEVR